MASRSVLTASPPRSGSRWSIISLTSFVLLFPGCQAGAQLDSSGLGESPLAEQLRTFAWAGSNERNEKGLAAWTENKCNVVDVDSARVCAQEIGMECEASESTSVSCHYQGTNKMRMTEFFLVPALAYRTQPWNVCTIGVEFLYSSGEPAVFKYSQRCSSSGGE